MNIKSIKEIKNLKGLRVLLRADFNVPVEGGRVVDDFRIKKTIPTIKYLKQKGAKVIIVSHIGEDGTQSLEPVAKVLNKYIPTFFVPQTLPQNLILRNGEVALLENIRREKGEKENDKAFAKKLSTLADVYINDAFSVSHREHASIVGVPKYLPHYGGFQLLKEIESLNKVLEKPKHPFLFILGGAKFSTKMPLIKKFLKIADHLSITGALANDFLKASGFEVGASLVDDGDFGIKSLLNNKKILLPVDVVVDDDNKGINKNVAEVKKNEKIVDIGTESVREIEMLIKKSKMVLWNGPTGNYENGWDKGTLMLLKILAKSKTQTIIGGGDTVALVSKLKMEDKFSFVSTGGGATLEYLSKGTLVGIKALEK